MIAFCTRHSSKLKTKKSILLSYWQSLAQQPWSATLHVFRPSWKAQAELHKGAIEASFMADYMLATQRSATQHRAVHRTSPLTALKALRWLSKISEWQELCIALRAPVVSSYAQATISKDRRESYPIPLSVIVGFERAVCDPTTSDTIALLLGDILLCTHASLRFGPFGDAQRIAWHSPQLSPAALHGTCYRTKTSLTGQPFAVRWHGVAGRDFRTSWVLHWLGRLARQYTAPRTGPLARAQPDFMFINCNPQRYLCLLSFVSMLSFHILLHVLPFLLQAQQPASSLACSVFGTHPPLLELWCFPLLVASGAS